VTIALAVRRQRVPTSSLRVRRALASGVDHTAARPAPERRDVPPDAKIIRYPLNGSGQFRSRRARARIGVGAARVSTPRSVDLDDDLSEERVGVVVHTVVVSADEESVAEEVAHIVISPRRSRVRMEHVEGEVHVSLMGWIAER
jgi:hypothetical protein